MDYVFFPLLADGWRTGYEGEWRGPYKAPTCKWTFTSVPSPNQSPDHPANNAQVLCGFPLKSFRLIAQVVTLYNNFSIKFFLDTPHLERAAELQDINSAAFNAGNSNVYHDEVTFG
jgi:hypothetical protein